jgi:hypothetical protein
MFSLRKRITILMLLVSVPIAFSIWIYLGNKLPETKPNNFNFVLNYGIGSGNTLDTAKGKYTKTWLSVHL